MTDDRLGAAISDEPTIPAVPDGSGPSLGADLRRLVSRSVVYGLGSLATAGISFILLPLYTRYLTPADYGTVAVASAIGAVLSVILPLGLHGAVTRFYFEARDPGARRERVGSIWAAMIVSSITLTIVTMLIGPQVFQVLIPSVPFFPFGALAVATAFASVFARVPLLLFQIEERPLPYVLASLATALITTGFTLALVVFLGRGAVGYLLGALAGATVMALPFLVLTLRRVAVSWRVQTVRSALAYGAPLVPHGLASWTLELSDRAVLQRFVSLAALGLYSLAYQFGTLMNVIGSALNNAWIPLVYRRLNDANPAAESGISRLATYFAFLVAWAGLALALLAGDVITLLTPASFHEAIQLAPWIVVGCTFQALYYLPGNFIMARGGTSRIALATFVSGGANVLLNLALAPRFGIVAAAWSTLISYAILLGLTWRFGQQAFAVRYEYPRLAKVALTAAAVFGVGMAIGNTGDAIAIGARLSLWAAFPVLLLMTGFATADESQTVRLEIRALRSRWAKLKR